MAENRIKRHRTAIVVGAILLLLVGLRAALPYIVKAQVNSRLAAMENYNGHLQDIDLALWRGEYRIVNLVIEKTGVDSTEPFLQVPEAAISLQWGALLDGAIVGEVELFAPTLHVTTAENPEQAQTGEDESWYDLLEDLVPFTINRLAIHDGHFEFDDADAESPLDVHVSAIDAVALNLSNASDEQADTFASATLTGVFGDDTPLRINGQLSPLASPPAFEVDLELETLPLPELNGLLREYVGVDAEAGTFSVYSEFAAANGLFEGYIKPILENAEFFELDASGNPLRQFWEAIVAVAAELLENQSEDQIASQIPFSGELDQADIGVFSAVLSILENAFIAALEQELNHTVEIENLGADGQ